LEPGDILEVIVAFLAEDCDSASATLDPSTFLPHLTA
jgi:hypothetical protein